MIEKGEELWLMHISRRNDSAKIKLLFTVHGQVSVLFNLSPLGSANIIKLIVKLNSFIEESICILVAFIFTSH